MRSTWFKVGAAVVAAGALVAGAFIAGGYDVAQTKVDDGSVWALQKQGDGMYARVDTALGQLDTVKSIPHPSDVSQADGHVLLYSQSYAKMADVDLAQPVSYEASKPAGLTDTPADTTSVVHTGDYVAYLSSTGAVRAGRIDDDPKNLQPITAPGSHSRPFSADTVAIGEDGMLYAYSHTTRSVLRYDLKTSRAKGTDAVAGGPTQQKPTITVVGDTWVLLSQAGTKLWIRGLDRSVATKLTDSVMLQQPSGKQSIVAVASATSLVSFNLKDGHSTVLTSGRSGAPAAPSWNGSKLYAAWVGTESAGGSLWAGSLRLSGAFRSQSPRLDFNGHLLQVSTPTPVFVSNGGAEILNEQTSGWVWSVPSGKIVDGSQNWTLPDNNQQVAAPKNTTQRETNPKPPTAVKDAFGVRAGSLVSLPVMLNDYDANGDVISIVPGSLTGLNPTFGAASIANNGQTVTVQTRPQASGTATFEYTITDGTASDGGLKSKPATVTLTVSPAGSNKAPVWCNGASDSDCLYPWPKVEVAPGGSAEVPVLRGWVDPDGDPMFAQAAANNDQYSVSTSPDGTLVFHAASSARAQTVNVPVVISDVNGLSTRKSLRVDITGKPTLTVENFGLMTAAGVPLTVDPSSHISGTTGSPRIASATLAASSGSAAGAGDDSSSDGATVNVDSSQSTFDFTAKKPGSYPVTMTVTDSADKSATATATVRITVVPANQPLLSTSPVTVFVRPKTDTSVDVFSAVQNPTGRVLLLSHPQPKPATGASLDVDVVGQSQLRVRGDTSTEAPGLLGTVDYTVSDGTNTPAMTVQGVATVYLLPANKISPPVAINDSVTVRAGAQVDIPVLANDIGSDGDLVELDPSSIEDPSHQGLAFASGQVLRYLAPDTSPGTKPITLRYAAYSAGAPQQKSIATVTVTILSADGDRPPQPQTLTGRVAAGATVRIPFSSYGIDPDGDMVTLDRITTQPDSGVAQISADGTAITYTALADTQGQQQFSYRVRDSQGETGVATVMVGVLNAQADPAPVTFSDYVQVKAGTGNKVVVQPTANDVDPQGGALKLVSVTPDAPKDSTLYGVLQRNIKSTTGSQVVITATPDARTLTYTYSVRNAQGDVSAGLIVVDVVNGHVPDYPVVVDTVVDAQGLSHLDQGIDVVAGKVSWGSGDIGGLRLSLYKKMDGVSVSGNSIKVTKVPDSGLLVPFELSGTDFTGQPAETYGFLRVPAASDVILALKSDAPTLKVREGGTAHIKDVASIVSTPPGQVLNVQTGKLATTKARKNATCSVDNANTLTYSAGDGAPWTDACLLPVKLSGQSEWTIVAVPVEITPKQPQPELRPASLTVSPGQRAVTFDLNDMTTWLGHDDLRGLSYRVSYGGALFSVSSGSHSISVRAKDTDQPGLEEVAHVTVTGPTGASTSADITLKVGPAPSTRPAGGSTTLSCSESQGDSCTKTVVGLRDEVNAYGTPLKVVGVTSSVTGCQGVTFSLSGDSAIAAHWGAGAPGGTCTVPFTVQDAQGKRSSSSGSGTLSFELKGYPAAPAFVSQVAYSGDSVTLSVEPGASASSYPAITGFKVYVDGRASVTCDVSGACPPVSGLKNGDKHTFQVKSVNSVGESRSSVKTVGWAFAQPVLKHVKAQPVYDKNATTSNGYFTVTIQNDDSTASSYQVQAGDTSLTVAAGSSSSVTTSEIEGPANTNVDIVVTPISEFSVPPGDQVGATSVSASVTPVGEPTLSGGSAYASSNSTITVSPPPVGSRNGSSSDAFLYFAAPAGNDPDCSNTGDGTNIGYSHPSGSDWAASSSPTLSGLNQFEAYEVYACYTNGFGIAKVDLGSVTVWDQSNAPVPSGCTYSITRQGTGLPDYEYGDNAPACASGSTSGAYHLVISGSQTTFGTTPSFTAKYCDPSGKLCGQGATVSAADGSAPFQMQVTAISSACNVPASGPSSITVAPNNDQGVPQAGPTVSVSQYDYTTDGTTWRTMSGDGTNLPAGTTAVRSIRYTITWGQSGFDSYRARTSDDAVTCTTN